MIPATRLPQAKSILIQNRTEWPGAAQDSRDSPERANHHQLLDVRLDRQGGFTMHAQENLI
jgi:hypothetical protein